MVQTAKCVFPRLLFHGISYVESPKNSTFRFMPEGGVFWFLQSDIFATNRISSRCSGSHLHLCRHHHDVMINRPSAFAFLSEWAPDKSQSSEQSINAWLRSPCGQRNFSSKPPTRRITCPGADRRRGGSSKPPTRRITQGQRAAPFFWPSKPPTRRIT